MGNTQFFKKASEENPVISWKDLFSESFVKHSRADREYAMQVGTMARQVSEANMLESWHRPWLWWSAAKYGLALVGVLYAAFYICMFFLDGVAVSLLHMVMIIPPVVIPLIILIFMWEMNIPQNISLMELLSYFLAGGILSFAINTVFFLPFPNHLPSYYAALREEPGKLGAALLILLYMERVQKKKMYGFTGIVVGAVVGAAFSGIESVSYAINYSGNIANMIDVQITRALLALGGHITYCLPYVTAIALGAENGKLTAKCFLNPGFFGSFLFSVVLHAIWNGCGSQMIQVGIVIASPFILLYWIKKALKEIVGICGQKNEGTTYPAAADGITLLCKTTSLAGTYWRSSGDPIIIGRQKGSCAPCFPEETGGVSRQHCRIYQTGNGWFVEDSHSTYGTYVNGRKLSANEKCPLHSGDNLYLGSKQVWLTVL